MPSLLDKIRWDSAAWRALAQRGASRGPPWLQRWSPAPIGLAFSTWPGRRRSTLVRRLQEVLGPRSALDEARLVAKTYVTFAHGLADSLAMAETHHAVSVTASGVENLHDALSRKKGVILATAHTAGWEVALSALRSHCPAPIAVLMRKERDQVARRSHATLASSKDLVVIEVGNDALAALPLVAHLRRGGIVAVQMDRCPEGVRSCVGRSAGVRWRLPLGPFVLASTTGAPIITTLSSRIAFRRYHTELSQPVALPRRPSTEESTAAADRIAGELVRFVRDHPGQWLAFDW